jgi:hypothetical protein
LIYLIDKYDLLNEFRIGLFSEIEAKINSIAPSVCEYHFENIILYSQTQSYLNRNQIEKEFLFGSFKLYIDYEENLYVEKDELFYDDESSQNSSLW